MLALRSRKPIFGAPRSQQPLTDARPLGATVFNDPSVGFRISLISNRPSCDAYRTRLLGHQLFQQIHEGFGDIVVQGKKSRSQFLADDIARLEGSSSHEPGIFLNLGTGRHCNSRLTSSRNPRLSYSLGPPTRRGVNRSA